jgi:large subunit ribosomal protein L10
VRKQEKAEIVQEIQEKVAKSQIGILSDFKGLKVEDMTRLRRSLQEAGGELKVVPMP